MHGRVEGNNPVSYSHNVLYTLALIIMRPLFVGLSGVSTGVLRGQRQCRVHWTRTWTPSCIPHVRPGTRLLSPGSLIFPHVLLPFVFSARQEVSVSPIIGQNKTQLQRYRCFVKTSNSLFHHKTVCFRIRH